MATRSTQRVVDVDGRRLSVTSLDKVLYPATGTTKADVLAYYQAVAPLMVPQVAWRPVTRKRWPDGVGTEDAPGEVFFSKNLESFAPDWVPRFPIRHTSRTANYPLANEAAVLAWFGQVAALELHTPQWRFGADGEPRNPDRLVLDLDPGPGAGLPECAQVARLCRALLDGMGMPSFPVTSGSKGLHLYAALPGTHTSDQVSAVARELARALEADHRDLVVSTQKRSARAGKVLVDWSQNSASKTTVSPYSLRGRTRPTVAAPRTWEEIDRPDLAHLEYTDVLGRLDLDPLAPLALPARPGGVAPAAPDRLTVYRSMRDAERTPEPVPAAGGRGDGAGQEAGHGAGGAPTFVIQEHHARRLHWDFRLEREGVLVSWAVPKGPPMSGDQNRLAVPTEDHPLDYGSFEGTIPRGEYGAGEVTIWDAGTYEPEKWREDEVIATLTGRPDGGLGGEPYRFALIRTGTRGAKATWLLHRMEPAGAGKKSARTSAAARGAPTGTTKRSAPGAAKRSAPGATKRSSPGAAKKSAPGTTNGTSARGTDRTSRPSGRGARTGATTGTRGGGAAGSGADLPMIEPMLATLATIDDLRTGDDWWCEMKWDGVRAIVTVDPGAPGAPGAPGDRSDPGAAPAVRVRGRSGKDVTRTYPEVAAVADLLDVPCVLDGEIVALRRGRPDFGLLQRRIGLTAAREVAAEAERTPVKLVVFDVLHAGGESLLRVPYAERRERLAELLGEGSEHVWVPDAVAPGKGAARRAMEVSRDLGLEGIVAKRATSTYQQGRRARTWLKIKHDRTQDVVVIGRRASTAARPFASLLLAVPDEDGVLRYAGRVGTGFSDAELKRADAALRRIERATPPVDDVPAQDRRDATWVRPTLVGEVTHAGRTAGGALRHAVWRGWRPDADAADVRWEAEP